MASPFCTGIKKNAMFSMYYTMVILVLTSTTSTEAKSKPPASFQNTFGIRETDARSATTSDEIVEKLGLIADALQFSNQQVYIRTS